MKTGYRVEMSEKELNTILTACSVRLQAIAIILANHPEEKYLTEQYHELRNAMGALENAEYFIKTGV